MLSGRFDTGRMIIEPANSCPHCHGVIRIHTILRAYPGDPDGYTSKCACPYCTLLIGETSWRPALVMTLTCLKMKKHSHRKAANGRGGSFKVLISKGNRQ